jgi:putative SOS response-associated peptidase YedK
VTTVDIEVFSFMTTLPNALTSTINHERSPALLTSEAEYCAWLTGTPEEAFGLIRSSDAARMRIVQSGFDKEDDSRCRRAAVGPPLAQGLHRLGYWARSACARRFPAAT